MTPTDLAQRTYLENRLEALIARQAEAVHAAAAARAHVDGLPKRRLCPHEVARLEGLAAEAEGRSTRLARAITSIAAELTARR